MPSIAKNRRSSETSSANAPSQSSIQKLRGDARRSRCSLPISNASSDLAGSNYRVHVVLKMILSQPPIGISGYWPSSDQCSPQQGDQAGMVLAPERNQSDSSIACGETKGFFRTIGPMQPVSGAQQFLGASLRHWTFVYIICASKATRQAPSRRASNSFQTKVRGDHKGAS